MCLTTSQKRLTYNKTSKNCLKSYRTLLRNVYLKRLEEQSDIKW